MKNVTLANKYIWSLVAFTMLAWSCQNEEFGFEEEEIHQTAIERTYAKEFKKSFPNIDPNHTWTCAPDTFLYNVSGAQTRAGGGLTVPVVNRNSDYMNMTYDQVRGALNFMAEEDNNTGKSAQNFEYIALEETTYEIYPTFWGRKFSDTNYVGVFYIDSDGHKHDLEPFWNDTDKSLKAVYEGKQYDIAKTESMLTDVKITVTTTNTCTTCSGHGTVTCGTCKGSHSVNCSKCNGKGYTGLIINKKTCNTCSGSGKVKCTKCSEDGKVKCTTCNGTGHTTSSSRTVSPQSYDTPHFTLTVPAGMKWGLYLKTRKQQNTDNWITWYSNAEYNPDKVAAAATFTYANVTYCSFEDAPHNLHKGSKTGNCKTCGYGHYDLDYNDIVLTITPRPVESTYRALKNRVMCEDLGGTFDWDFNDVVYDIVYEDGMGSGSMATVNIIVQAVGGTLPVHMVYDGKIIMDELHELFGERKDAEGHYRPINVKGQGSVRGLREKTIKTITLEKETYDIVDLKSFAKKINLQVTQDKGITTMVTFPKENGNHIPQCFMTSVGTEWPDELQNISKKYSEFPKWVANQNLGQEWYRSTY